MQKFVHPISGMLILINAYHIATHHAKYRLENYSTEEIIKKIFLTGRMNKLKSKYRKRICGFLFTVLSCQIPDILQVLI